MLWTSKTRKLNYLYIIDVKWFNDLTIVKQNELKHRFNIGEITNLKFPHVVYDY
jgi:hypothetical protein